MVDDGCYKLLGPNGAKAGEACRLPLRLISFAFIRWECNLAEQAKLYATVKPQ